MTLRLSARDAHALGLAPQNKYGNERIVVDGVSFPSLLEANHWQMLKRRERAGEIANLQRQVRYPIVVNGVKVCTYVADFTWTEVATGMKIVADAKGFATNTYRIKAKLVEALYGVVIVELKD